MWSEYAGQAQTGAWVLIGNDNVKIAEREFSSSQDAKYAKECDGKYARATLKAQGEKN